MQDWAAPATGLAPSPCIQHARWPITPFTTVSCRIGGYQRGKARAFHTRSAVLHKQLETATYNTFSFLSWLQTNGTLAHERRSTVAATSRVGKPREQRSPVRTDSIDKTLPASHAPVAA